MQTSWVALAELLMEAVACQKAKPEPAYDHSQLAQLLVERNALVRAVAIVVMGSRHEPGFRDVCGWIRNCVENDADPSAVALTLAGR